MPYQRAHASWPHDSPELFEQDVEIVERLNKAQRQLTSANERLWSGLAPDAFGPIYDGAAAAAIATSPIGTLIRDGGPAANSQLLEALQQAHWKIHRAFCAYQHACEQRRQLAIDVGECSQQLTQALCATGWSAHEARTPTSTNSPPRHPETPPQPPVATVPRVIEVQLTAGDFQLELYVDGYEFPEFDTGRDANTLACEIELDLRRHLDLHAAHTLILDTLKLASFVDQLRALEHAHDGEATLGNPDEHSGDQFGLTIRLKDGTGTLDGFFTDSTTARLSFEQIDIDRTFVRDALAQFAAIAEAFPVRGDITAD